jgi:hypothetical protein
MNQVVFSERYLKLMETLNLPPEQKQALLDFSIAHEISHFILDHYIRQNPAERSPFGSRSSVSIAASFASSAGEDQNKFIDEYNLQHQEVDAVALVLLKRCGVAIPTAASFFERMNHQYPNEKSANRCREERKRIHHLLETLRYLK